MAEIQPCPTFDVEFSLSIYNRTGKFFIGELIIENCADLLGSVYYWRYRGRKTPQGLFGKIIGRIQHLQVVHTATGGIFGRLPRRKLDRPMLHIDPFSILSTQLRPIDAVIIHDIGAITHPRLFDPKTPAIYDMIFKEIASVGPHAIFVSKATQQAFRQRFGGERLASQRVIYPHIRTEASTGAATPIQIAGETFLLMTGALGIRKNQTGAIQAFVQSGLAERGVKLVLCGANEPGHQSVRDLAAKTFGVVLLNYVSDSELRWLYANARGFVLPSLLEGFGMPVAEAIQFGLIPIISSNSVLEEVAGEGALAVNPLDEAAIADAMICVVDMSAAERVTRCEALKGAISRFSEEQIIGDWRFALNDMRR